MRITDARTHYRRIICIHYRTFLRVILGLSVAIETLLPLSWMFYVLSIFMRHVLLSGPCVSRLLSAKSRYLFFWYTFVRFHRTFCQHQSVPRHAPSIRTENADCQEKLRSFLQRKKKNERRQRLFGRKDRVHLQYLNIEREKEREVTWFGSDNHVLISIFPFYCHSRRLRGFRFLQTRSPWHFLRRRQQKRIFSAFRARTAAAVSRYLGALCIIRR